MKEYNLTLVIIYVPNSQRSERIDLIVKSPFVILDKTRTIETTNGFDGLRLTLYLPRISSNNDIQLVFVFLFHHRFPIFNVKANSSRLDGGITFEIIRNKQRRINKTKKLGN